MRPFSAKKKESVKSELLETKDRTATSNRRRSQMLPGTSSLSIEIPEVKNRSSGGPMSAGQRGQAFVKGGVAWKAAGSGDRGNPEVYRLWFPPESREGRPQSWLTGVQVNWKGTRGDM